MLTTIDIIIRIACAIGLGSLIGLERTLAGKGAGMRTYAMVALGSSVFVIISETVIASLPGNQLLAGPLTMPAAIITGIGFIGAGLTMFKDRGVTGLTTAAGLWVAAAVGIASGFGFFNLAIISTIAGILVFTVLWFVENLLKRFSYYKDNIAEEDNHSEK